MRHIASVCFAIGLASLMPACSSDGDDLDCSFAACGGDPVGEWSVDGFCFDTAAFEDDFQQFCASASASVSVSATGSVSIGADNTYASDTSISMLATVTLPSDCFTGQPIQSCSDLEDGDVDVTCTGDPSSSCRCRFTNNEDASATGTWQSSGDTITLTEDGGGSPEQSLYCQQGNSLKVQSIPTDADDPVTTIVLSRM